MSTSLQCCEPTNCALQDGSDLLSRIASLGNGGLPEAPGMEIGVESVSGDGDEVRPRAPLPGPRWSPSSAPRNGKTQRVHGTGGKLYLACVPMPPREGPPALRGRRIAPPPPP